MCDRNVKSEYILIKLCTLVFEYIGERTTKFHEKILFDSRVTQYSVLFAVTHAPFHVPSAEASSGPSARDRRDREVN